MNPFNWNEKDIATSIEFEKIFKTLCLGFQLKSGLQNNFYGINDWVVFNEIFIQGEYDEAILSIIKNIKPGSHEIFRVLDLGANSGLFTLRTLDLYLQNKLEPEKIKIHSIEGNPKTYKDLIRRIKENKEAIEQCVKVHCGLVGNIEGKAEITDYQVSCYNSLTPLSGGLFSQQRKLIKVPYLNLNHVTQGSTIDLIKCDIEGAEQDFLENYPELLSQAKHLIIEIHHSQCDVGRCRSLITEYGFTLQKSLRDDPVEVSQLSVEFYSR
ncbi:MAG: FkbM family methyltransferase [Verrucomicrobiota bacterium]